MVTVEHPSILKIGGLLFVETLKVEDLFCTDKDFVVDAGAVVSFGFFKFPGW